jgi:cell division protein FtsB
VKSPSLKSLTLIFVILIAALQYPLWLSKKGSWLTVWNLNQQISQQKEKNDNLKARNASLDEEVRDLKQGYAAIEERARSELGMVKQDEVFIQVLDPSSIALTKPVNLAPETKQPETKKPAKQ